MLAARPKDESQDLRPKSKARFLRVIIDKKELI
jgi:hypothetical protein